MKEAKETFIQQVTEIENDPKIGWYTEAGNKTVLKDLIDYLRTLPENHPVFSYVKFWATTEELKKRLRFHLKLYTPSLGPESWIEELLKYE